MFNFIGIVDDLGGITSSTAFAYECLNERCSINNDVWIKYYRNATVKESVFTVGNNDTPLGGVPTIMFYVSNDDGTYSVYQYDGKLEIDRRIVKKLRHDILLNIDDIINELVLFLENNSSRS